MSLYSYFAKASKRNDLPDPSGPFSALINPVAIKEANNAVKTVSERKSKRRKSYAKFMPEQQAPIGKYASLHGNQAAIRHFSKQLKVEFKVTSVQTWKTKYLAKLNRRHKEGEIENLTVKLLRGRPLLLREKLDSEVKADIQAAREGGGVVTASITMAAAIAII